MNILLIFMFWYINIFWIISQSNIKSFLKLHHRIFSTYFFLFYDYFNIINLENNFIIYKLKPNQYYPNYIHIFLKFKLFNEKMLRKLLQQGVPIGGPSYQLYRNFKIIVQNLKIPIINY